jgi:hypothetical protein
MRMRHAKRPNPLTFAKGDSADDIGITARLNQQADGVDNNPRQTAD